MRVKIGSRIYFISYKIIIPCGIILIIIIGFFGRRLVNKPQMEIILGPEASIDVVQPATPLLIQVYVIGYVTNPSVVEIESGELVRDAIEKAGGFTEGADKEAINLARKLESNTMIRVPGIGETVDETESEADEEESGGKININTATKTQLTQLSGIGDATAQKIVDYRSEHGFFKAIEDIMNVPGIKEAKFLAFKDMIKVN
jgi:competence protein ComEA